MKGRTLAVVVVVGLCVVGWAVFYLLGRGGRHTQTVGAADPQPQRDSGPRATPRRPPVREPISAEQPERAPEPPTPPEPRPAPTRAKPEMTIDEARAHFDDYIADLDREIERGAEVGRELSNEDWVQYYKRGHETLDPLLRLLDHSDPDQAKEVRDKQELMRRKLRELQARPETPP